MKELVSSIRSFSIVVISLLVFGGQQSRADVLLEEHFNTDVIGSGEWMVPDQSVSIDTENGWLHIASDGDSGGGHGDYADKFLSLTLPVTVEARMRLVSGGQHYTLPAVGLYWGPTNDQSYHITYLPNTAPGEHFGWKFMDVWTDVHTMGPVTENVWITIKAVIRSDGGELFAKGDADIEFTPVVSTNWTIPAEMIRLRLVQHWDAVCDFDYVKVSKLECPALGKVAYYKLVNGNYKIFMMNLGGTNSEMINTGHTNHDITPDPSNDGTRIVFVNVDQMAPPHSAARLCVYNFCTGILDTLLDAGYYVDWPRWSPDDSTIAFTSYPSGASSSRIWLINSDGTNLRQLMNTNLVCVGGDWSPDGSRYAFGTDSRISTGEAYYYDFRCDALVQLTFDGPYPSPSLSPYAWSAYGDSLLCENAPFSQLAIVDVKKLTTSTIMTNTANYALWCTNGRIYYCANSGGSVEIFSMNPDGSDIRNISNTPGDEILTGAQLYPRAVTINQPPVANAGRDSTLLQCAPAQICIAAGCSDVDNNLNTCQLLSGPGTYDGSQICFTPEVSGTYTLIIEATDACGLVDYDTSVVSVSLNQAPVADAGRDTTLLLCQAGQVCIPAGCSDVDGNLEACEMIKGPGEFDGSSICFTPTASGVYEFVVRATDACGVQSYDTSMANIQIWVSNAVMTPDPVYVYYRFALSPMDVTVCFGNWPAGYNAIDVDLGTIKLDGLAISSAEVVGSCSGFQGGAVVAIMPISRYLSQFPPLYDTTTQTFEVTWSYNNSASGCATGDVKVIGHVSNAPGLYITPSDLVVFRGDFDVNGLISISDVVSTISYIFAGGLAPANLGIGDTDCSGFISISDAVYLIQYIFDGGSAPSAICP